MIAIEHSDDNRKLLIRASGRLSAGDYEAALPELRHAMAVAPGPLRVLVRLEGFEGWEFSAFLERDRMDADPLWRVGAGCNRRRDQDRGMGNQIGQPRDRYGNAVFSAGPGSGGGALAGRRLSASGFGDWSGGVECVSL